MVVGFLLSFIVPSTTARVACLMPIMMGFVLAFKVDRKSRFAALLVITTAQTASIWIPWGTVVLFAVGISVGSALLQTKAAGWLAQLIVGHLGLQMASAFAILMLLSAFLIVIHLGFASATALASTMIPIVISVLSTVQTPGINIVGMTMILQFVVSFGFILPVNAPQNMIAYGTDTFDAHDFVRTGIVITLTGVVLLVVFALTYWPWLGLMVTRT